MWQTKMVACLANGSKQTDLMMIKIRWQFVMVWLSALSSIHSQAADPETSQESSPALAAASDEITKQQREMYEEAKSVLEGEWDEVTFSLLHICSCTGPMQLGFQIERSSAQSKVAPWSIGRWNPDQSEQLGESQNISPEVVARLVSEGTRQFQSATLSLAPMEISGSPGKRLMGDAVGMRIRVKTGEGEKSYFSWMKIGETGPLSKWLSQFGINRDRRR